MRLYSPEDIDHALTYVKWEGEAEKKATIGFPKGSNWEHKNDRVADTAQEAYHCDKSHILEAISECSHPHIQALLRNLDLYITSFLSAKHINAAANASGVIFYGRATPIPKAMTHYLTIHELGHVLDTRFVRTDEKLQERYFQLRGWERATNTSDLPWTKKINEWFAEDFRYLFGGMLAKQDHWACACEPPGEEIKAFMLEALNGKTETKLEASNGARKMSVLMAMEKVQLAEMLLPIVDFAR